MNQKELNDIFYAAQDGDNDSFKKLFNAFWDMAYYSCLKHLRNEHDAEDAVQEVFIILHRRIKKVKGFANRIRSADICLLGICIINIQVIIAIKYIYGTPGRPNVDL